MTKNAANTLGQDDLLELAGALDMALEASNDPKIWERVEGLRRDLQPLFLTAQRGVKVKVPKDIDRRLHEFFAQMVEIEDRNVAELEPAVAALREGAKTADNRLPKGDVEYLGSTVAAAEREAGEVYQDGVNADKAAGDAEEARQRSSTDAAGIEAARQALQEDDPKKPDDKKPKK